MKKNDQIRSETVIGAIRQSIAMLNPVNLAKNPVMFIVEVGSLLTTVLAVRAAVLHTGEVLFSSVISLWLWLTLLFANFAESLAELQGKAQAESLRTTRAETFARLVVGTDVRRVSGSSLKKWDKFLLSPGEIVPTDGEIISGVASIDESAITGESAPVIREAGGDRSGVTGGTRVLAGEITVVVAANPGETFLDRMIALVEGATRKKSPNEIALSILLIGLTLIFLLVVATLPAFASYAKVESDPVVLIALLVCLIPTTIAGLLPAIGIAGIDRAFRANVVAKSGKAVEVAGDIDLLLLDKTGTITFGNRQAVQLLPAQDVSREELARACRLASLHDQTPEGKSTLTLAESEEGLRGESGLPERLEPVPFTPETRMSGADTSDGAYRKGSEDAIESYLGTPLPPIVREAVSGIAQSGGTPLVVVRDRKVLGVIHLKDIVKPGLTERFERLRRMGVSTVMVTGDNPLTAQAIAREAGIDDFFAKARPEDKMALIKKEQDKGRLVAMSGDGTNDAPSLAQADVALAMNSGTQAAKEAANMVDLDSDPTKIIEVVEIGKQLLITRGALTTFSVANDVAKYFAILPAMFVASFPQLGVLNIMKLSTPVSAVTSAIIFNALISPALIPLALKGVRYRPVGAAALLRRNLLVYGLGGILVPFLGIKLIDMALTFLHFS
ncbi:MAG: potassium-transporting ATPase subunit KdpB [Leptospirales bacterium]